jgi:hypothetical protein
MAREVASISPPPVCNEAPIPPGASAMIMKTTKVIPIRVGIMRSNRLNM